MASNLVFYIDEYFDTDDPSPSVIYIYDQGGITSGNLLAEIAYETNFIPKTGGSYDANTFAYDTDGNWIGYLSQQHPYVIAASPDGRCYVGSAPVSVAPEVYDGYVEEYQLDYFRVYRTDGQRIPFPQLHGARIRAIAVDANRNIYVGGDTLDTVDHYVGGKYDADGTLLWRMTGVPRVPDSPFVGGQRDFIYGIAVDASGNVYTCGGNDYDYGVIRKYNASGVIQWTVHPNDVALYIVVDTSGNVYTAMSSVVGAYGQFIGGVDWDYFYPFVPGNTTYNVIKWDSSGAFVSGFSVSPEPSTGPRLFAGDGALEVTWRDRMINDFYWKTYQYDLTVAATNTFVSRELAVAPDGTVYPNPLDFNGGLSVAVVETDQVMSLALPLGLAIPVAQGDRYVIAPGLAIPLALAIPAMTLEYSGSLLLVSVFRLSLTGGSGAIELPLASFQLRRTANSTWCSAVSPSPTAAILADVEARTGGSLVIHHGVRFPDNTEQLDVLFSAPFSKPRFDAGSRSASLTMEATGAGESGGYLRVARGVSYRSEITGLRRVRCAVDTYLRPGDVLDLGGAETLIVGSITYQITPQFTVMEVSESA